MKPQIDFDVSMIPPPEEGSIESQRMCEIRFDCLVRMHDFGAREVGGMFNFSGKHLPPQWFRLHHKMTLDFVRTGDPYVIGQTIKEAYQKLENYIKQYEGK